MCVYLVQELVLNLEQGIELVAESHGMDDHRIVAVEVQDADLQERAVAVRADEHQNLIHVETLHRIANSVEHVIVIYTMLSGWFADPHLDNLPCLSGSRQEILS